MKTAALLFLSLALTGWAMPSSAHDPKEHQKEAAQTADCSKMKSMDMSKMDMNDPVVKAMHKKCSAYMSKPGSEHEATEHGTTEHDGHTGHDDAIHPSAPKDSSASAPATNAAKRPADKSVAPASGAGKTKTLLPAKRETSAAGTP